MSNQQWPPPGQPPQGPSPQGHSPWQQPDPNWSGPQFSDKQGRDPRLPFGAKPPTANNQPSIDHFAEDPGTKHETRQQLTIVILVVVVIAAVFIGLQFVGGDNPGTETDETASPQISFDPTAAATNNRKVPFEGNGTGTFELLDSSWSGNQVTVRYRITLDEGREYFTVFLFSNETKMQYMANENTESRVVAGSPLEATATFTLDRGDATLVLATSAGQALTAVPVSQ